MTYAVTGLRIGATVPGLNAREIIDLPVDFITESSTIIAKKGAGKTNATLVLAEEAFGAGCQVVTIDPKGDHWGIRSGRDGDTIGLPIAVFGGRHGDIPLEPTAGRYIAELLRSTRLSAVIDVSQFTNADRARFLAPFADAFLRYDSRDPVLLLLEEAHEYIPQMVRGEVAKMVSAFERLVKLGRSNGIGVVMVTQRSASLNKDVMTQSDNLFVLQTTSPQDRAAVKAWIDTNADHAEIMATLPGLEKGECWFVSPARGVPVRFRWRMRYTYDAGATPKVGEIVKPPTTLADVNLDTVAAAMADTIERSKADDPKHLRRELAERNARIASLEADLATARTTLPEPERVEVPVLDADDRGLLEERVVQLRTTAQHLKDQAQELDSTVGRIIAKLDAVRVAGAALTPPRVVPSRVQPALVQIPPRRLEPGERPVAPVVDDAEGSQSLTPSQASILRVLAQFPRPLSAKQVTARGGPSWKSSSFKSAVPTLRRYGLLADGSNDALVITDAGRAIIGPVEAPPTGRALLDWWQNRLKPTEFGVLRVLVDAYPAALSAPEVAEASGYSPGSSSFKAAIPALRNQELIDGPNTGLRADDVFAG